MMTTTMGARATDAVASARANFSDCCDVLNAIERLFNVDVDRRRRRSTIDDRRSTIEDEDEDSSLTSRRRRRADASCLSTNLGRLNSTLCVGSSVYVYMYVCMYRRARRRALTRRHSRSRATRSRARERRTTTTRTGFLFIHSFVVRRSSFVSRTRRSFVIRRERSPLDAWRLRLRLRIERTNERRTIALKGVNSENDGGRRCARKRRTGGGAIASRARVRERERERGREGGGRDARTCGDERARERVRSRTDERYRARLMRRYICQIIESGRRLGLGRSGR